MKIRSKKNPILFLSGLAVVVLAGSLLVGCDDDGNGTPVLSDDPVEERDGDGGMTALPPDPGPAGDETLEGIHTNDDGVRDDVEIAIYERYPESPEKRAALKQMARAVQKQLVAGHNNDDDAVIAAATQWSTANYCLRERIDNSLEEIGFIENAVANTDLREEAFQNYALAMDRTVTSGGNSENPCE